MLPQQHVKDPGRSAKSAGGRLQLNMHTALHGVDRMCTKMAALSCGMQLPNNAVTTSVDIQNALCEVSHRVAYD